MGHVGLGTVIVICLIFGAVTAAIGQKKNLAVGQSFAPGALLGIFGAIIVICQRPGPAQGATGHAGGEVPAVQHDSERSGDAARVRVLCSAKLPTDYGELLPAATDLGLMSWAMSLLRL